MTTHVLILLPLLLLLRVKHYNNNTSYYLTYLLLTLKTLHMMTHEDDLGGSNSPQAFATRPLRPIPSHGASSPTKNFPHTSLLAPALCMS